MGFLTNLLSPVKKPGVDEKEMSFLEHFDTLRKHLFRAALYVVVVGIFVFTQKTFVFDTIILGPTKADFATYRFFCSLSEALCFKPAPLEIFTRDLGEQLTIHLKVSFFLGFILSFPFVLREVWLFVKPGLYQKEQKAARWVVEVCSLLFLTGVLFGYYIVAPFSISFLASYNVSTLVKSSATLASIVDSMTMFTISTGLVFELPLAVFFLAKLGIMGPKFMRTYRRHAIVVITIVAAVITPPDVTSMLLITFPLLLLYEASIIIAGRVYPKEESIK